MRRTQGKVTVSTFALVISAALVACDPNSTPADGLPAPAQKKEPPQALDGQGETPHGKPSSDGPEDVTRGQSLVDATFSINATAAGMTVCSGQVQIKVNIAMKPGDKQLKLFEIPAGEVDCGLIGKVNLAEVLGGFAGAQPPDVKDPLVVAENMIAVQVIGMGVYEPARPMLPAFLTANRRDLAKLDRKVTVKLNDTYEKKAASGTVAMRVIGVGDAYKPEAMQRTFKDVLHFEVTNEGFDGVTKINNALFERMAFKFSLDPVAVLRIEFDGAVSDYMAAKEASDKAKGTSNQGSILDNFLGGSGSGSGGGPLGGLGKVLIGVLTKVIKVQLEMDLIKMQGVEDSVEAGNQSDDDGEEIGGKQASKDD